MGKTHKKYSDNQIALFYEEVRGICPLCTKPLIVKKSQKTLKQLQIAHIYPLNPKDWELELLKNEKKPNEDLNHDDNLIALCRDCHAEYDDQEHKTVEKYRKLCKIKEDLKKLTEAKNKWFDHPIGDEIEIVIRSLSNIKSISPAPLGLIPERIEDKCDNSIEFIKKVKIKDNVTYYYYQIKEQFEKLDTLTPYTSDKIYGQIKSYYLSLKQQGCTHDQVFQSMSQWIAATTKTNNIDASEIVIAFFIQNCEVCS